MAKKGYALEQIITKLREAEILLSQENRIYFINKSSSATNLAAAFSGSKTMFYPAAGPSASIYGAARLSAL